MKTFFSSLLIVFATLFVVPAHADEPTNTCPNGQILHQYVSATGTVAQNGTPTPTNPVEPTFYQQGDMILRKVGDYADSYDATTGKITRNVGVKVLDGTENWIQASGAENSYLSLPDAKSSNPILCSHFSRNSVPRIELTGVLRLYYAGSSTIYNNNTWKAYLASQYAAGTPVTVWYPLATAVEEDWPSSYCQPTIKIATTAYNTAQFNPVVTDLNSTIATIRNVVTNTINQTAAIADLQAIKQTRPADDYTDETNTENCPKFRQCLLVEDNNNTPHWYLIKDPVRDLVKSLRDNKINSAGETTTTAYAANGYDGTNGTVDSRYSKGYPAMRKLADGSTSVYTRQFSSTLLNGTNGGQYKTLGDQEWAVTWNGNETGTANSFLPGVIYGTSRCAKTKPSSTAVGTEGWNTIENSDPVNDAENIQSYVQCYCKMTGVGVDGEFTPVRDSSRAPWVFVSTRGSAVYCAHYCAGICANSVRDSASFRSAVLGFAAN